MVMQRYGGPEHGAPIIATLDDAIRYLASVHTRRSFAGDVEVIENAGPRPTVDDERLYRESWQILRAAATHRTPAPLGGINEAWIRRAEDHLGMTSAVTLEREQYRALLAMARNGLRPKAI